MGHPVKPDRGLVTRGNVLRQLWAPAGNDEVRVLSSCRDWERGTPSSDGYTSKEWFSGPLERHS